MTSTVIRFDALRVMLAAFSIASMRSSRSRALRGRSATFFSSIDATSSRVAGVMSSDSSIGSGAALRCAFNTSLIDSARYGSTPVSMR